MAELSLVLIGNADLVGDSENDDRRCFCSAASYEWPVIRPEPRVAVDRMQETATSR
jgi:hypothetical protein